MTVFAEDDAGPCQIEGIQRVHGAGRWVGVTTALGSEGMDTDPLIMHGEGGYEGLTAYLVMDFTTEPATFEGGIFPGEIAPFPEARRVAGAPPRLPAHGGDDQAKPVVHGDPRSGVPAQVDGRERIASSGRQ